MGTNFYTLDDMHIGKRSAAGLYCWDCGITLRKQGNKGVHYSESEWFDSCPICEQTREDESLDDSAVGRELGFNKSKFTEKKGVKGCASFRWAILPKDLKVKYVKDEYGKKMTYKEFMDMFTGIPIHNFESLGQDFF